MRTMHTECVLELAALAGQSFRAAGSNHVTGNDAMNQTYLTHHVQPTVLERPQRDPLHAVTGLLWGSLLGAALWLSVLSLALTS